MLLSVMLRDQDDIVGTSDDIDLGICWLQFGLLAGDHIPELHPTRFRLRNTIVEYDNG